MDDSHVNKDDDGETPCGAPQPNLIEYRPRLNTVHDDNDREGYDEDL